MLNLLLRLASNDVATFVVMAMQYLPTDDRRTRSTKLGFVVVSSRKNPQNSPLIPE